MTFSQEKTQKSGPWEKLKAKLIYGNMELLVGAPLSTVIRAVPLLPANEQILSRFPGRKNFRMPEDRDALLKSIPMVLTVVMAGGKKKERGPGFVTLYTDGGGTYWLRVVRGFHTAITESLASLEKLADETPEGSDNESLRTVNSTYRKLSAFFD